MVTGYLFSFIFYQPVTLGLWMHPLNLGLLDFHWYETLQTNTQCIDINLYQDIYLVYHLLSNYEHSMIFILHYTTLILVIIFYNYSYNVMPHNYLSWFVTPISMVFVYAFVGDISIINRVNQPITGWWFQPPWKMLVNWDDYSQHVGTCSKPPTRSEWMLKKWITCMHWEWSMWPCCFPNLSIPFKERPFILGHHDFPNPLIYKYSHSLKQPWK